MRRGEKKGGVVCLRSQTGSLGVWFEGDYETMLGGSVYIFMRDTGQYMEFVYLGVYDLRQSADLWDCRTRLRIGICTDSSDVYKESERSEPNSRSQVGTSQLCDRTALGPGCGSHERTRVREFRLCEVFQPSGLRWRIRSMESRGVASPELQVFRRWLTRKLGALPS